MSAADPINPQRVFWELSPRVPGQCAFSPADSGSSANWFARDLKIRRGMMASLSGNLATMGPGVPYAIAAKFAFPERPAIALVGDGAMQMNGTPNCSPSKSTGSEWSDPRLIVPSSTTTTSIRSHGSSGSMAGDPKFEASQELPDFAYASFAEMIGLRASASIAKRTSDAAWDEALAETRPTVLEFITDPEVPPFPPHISFEQAKSFASAVLKRDPAAGAMIRQSLKQMADTIMPGKGSDGS